MKRNVDLTSDRTFSLMRVDVFDLHSVLMRKYKYHPWSFKELLDSTTDSYGEVFFTGTKEDRKSKRFELDYSVHHHMCERCGGALSNPPWRVTGSLCVRCDKILSDLFYEPNHGEYLWSF